MWIIPKNYEPSNGFTVTAETLSESEESSLCAQSLSVRGKPSSLRTWSQKWKRDSWTRFLSGRMSRTFLSSPSQGNATCSSPLIPVKDLAMPESVSELKTIDTSGPIAESLFKEQGQDLSGSKTSKDTLRLDSPQSFQTWQKMVIQRRGEYSARLKSARLTKGKEFLFWPTVLCDSELAKIREWMAKGTNRTDELRMCGNGVVPATAERAFRVLSKELFGKEV